MTEKEAVRISKFLSLVLRHSPQTAGLKLNENGWVKVDELIVGCRKANRPISLDDLEFVVANNNKKRFEFNEDNTLIRASQGHSVEIKLEYAPKTPPDILYHGAATRNLDSIREKGLLKMKRHHVHLSADRDTAIQVGGRHGKPIALIIYTEQMHNDGFEFFQSTNEVWLVDHVPSKYIVFPA